MKPISKSNFSKRGGIAPGHAWTCTIRPTSWQHSICFERLGSRELLAATADFNGDGFDDLAIGAPGANEVSVIYGSFLGLTVGGKPTGGAPANQLLNQASLGRANDGGGFGQTLASGDLNGDGYADLAIAAPNLGSLNVGGVYVVYGSSTGLKTVGNQFFDQGAPGIEGVNEGFETFGKALAIGDFDGDGFDDLAAGCPGEFRLLGIPRGKGAVNVIYGSSSGLTASGDQFWDKSGLAISGDPDWYDEFGAALAAGDFDGDGMDDLAIGIPGDGPSFNWHGRALILYGRANIGLDTDGNQDWDFDSPGVPGSNSNSTRYGESLVASDFNGDGRDDLAIGIWSKTVNGIDDAGEVHIFSGTAAGLASTNLKLIHQDATGVADFVEAGDRFGSSLAVGDLNGDGFEDLLVGSPQEDQGGLENTGTVHVFFGSLAGIKTIDSKQLTQGFGGVADVAEGGDAFGAAIFAGDFNDDRKSDLVIGVPGEDSAGAIHVLAGSASGPLLNNISIINQATTGVPGDLGSNKQFGAGLPNASIVEFSGFSGRDFGVTQFPHNHKRPGKMDVHVSLTVFNPGTGLTNRSVVRYYLSDNGSLDKHDRMIKSVRLSAIEPGDSITIDFLKRLGRGKSWTGKHLIAVLDAKDKTSERNEANNLLVFGPIGD